MNEIETRKTTERINKTKLFYWKDKQKWQNIQTKKQREKTQINKIRNERGDITSDAVEI